jgi:hypothetical protein
MAPSDILKQGHAMVPSALFIPVVLIIAVSSINIICRELEEHEVLIMLGDLVSAM